MYDLHCRQSDEGSVEVRDGEILAEMLRGYAPAVLEGVTGVTSWQYLRISKIVDEFFSVFWAGFFGFPSQVGFPTAVLYINTVQIFSLLRCGASHAVDLRALSDEKGNDSFEILCRNIQFLHSPRHMATIV